MQCKPLLRLSCCFNVSGVHEEYDIALDDIGSIQRELDVYLDKQKKRLGCMVSDYIQYKAPIFSHSTRFRTDNRY